MQMVREWRGGLEFSSQWQQNDGAMTLFPTSFGHID
jgi:hypothetical protein